MAVKQKWPPSIATTCVSRHSPALDAFDLFSQGSISPKINFIIMQPCHVVQALLMSLLMLMKVWGIYCQQLALIVYKYIFLGKVHVQGCLKSKQIFF